jgi:hypothetical protein
MRLSARGDGELAGAGGVVNWKLDHKWQDKD